MAAGRWSPVVVSHISPGIGTTHPPPQKPVQTTRWESETEAERRKLVAPARQRREHRQTAGSPSCQGCRRFQPLQTNRPALEMGNRDSINRDKIKDLPEDCRRWLQRRFSAVPVVPAVTALASSSALVDSVRRCSLSLSSRVSLSRSHCDV